MAGRDKGDALRRFLEEEVWPRVPADVLGKRLTCAEREEILGYAPAHGVAIVDLPDSGPGVPGPYI